MSWEGHGTSTHPPLSGHEAETNVIERTLHPLALGRAEALPPLSPDYELDPDELNFQLGVLASTIATTLGSTHPLLDAVREARHDVAARDRAISLLNALPTQRWRHIAWTFSAVAWPRPPQADLAESRRRLADPAPPFASGLPT